VKEYKLCLSLRKEVVSIIYQTFFFNRFEMDRKKYLEVTIALFRFVREHGLSYVDAIDVLDGAKWILERRGKTELERLLVPDCIEEDAYVPEDFVAGYL